MTDTGRAVHGGEWSTPDIARIVRWLHAHAGLVFPASRRESAELGISRVMNRAGIHSVPEFGTRLQQGGALLDDLIAELTVGETYFLREPNQLEFIRREVLPSISARDGSCRAVRVWSAGCASGEEPYSLAILLHKTRCLETARIIGTDLSVARLVTARRARYRSWSMRGVPESIVSQYFERDGKTFTLRAELRKAVDFHLLNLAEDAYPSSATGVFGMDVILCRNVLIYFDLPTVTQVAQRLLNSLSDDGWLFLGASDPSLSGLIPCDVVLTGAGIAYRKPGATKRNSSSTFFTSRVTADVRDSLPPEGSLAGDGHSSLQPPATQFPVSRSQPAHPDSPTHSEIERAYAAGEYERAGAAALEALRCGDSSEIVSVALVRSLANRGMLREAVEAVADALTRTRTSAELHYLQGVLHAQAGQHEQAAKSARRALYLDPELIVAHLSLADAMARTGDSRAAKTAFRNAEDLLENVPAESSVRATDGETAARLLHIARFRIRSLTSMKP